MEIDATLTTEALPTSQDPFPVVGIGASAGGLEAFTHLFEHLPATTGMAYVVIQHLDPAHASLLPSLLACMTSMPVQEGQEGMALESDHVYVIPPHADLTLEHGRLHLLSRRPDHRPHLAIDTFFRALACDRKQHAIGVVLSGTATDGTQGLQAIKAEGGMTFAQDVHSAQYPQMPQSVIEAGWVDHILPPEEIARALARLRFPLAPLHDAEEQAPSGVPEGPAEAPSTEAEHLTTILLLLGSAESINPLSRLFTPIEKRQKLFAKNATDGSPLLHLARSGALSPGSHTEERGPHMREETTNMGEIQQEADRLLLAHYAPASVLIDAEMEILQVRGHTSPYLELAPGTISLNLLKMARDGLRLGLRTAVYAARKDNHPVTKENVPVTVAGITNDVRITVLPLKGPPTGQFFLVIFEATSPSPVPPIPSSGRQTEPLHKQGLAARRIAALEQELAATRAEMQAMLEERDAANEELQAANEEIRSSNEELQSSNEELETTQEELQAANQELTTANQILSTRNEQVQAASEYAEAIVETVRDPLLVLSQDLHIEHANTAFYQCFHVTPPETEGRALSELSAGQWDIPPLWTRLTHLQDTNQSFRDFEVEQVFPGIGHKIMLLNARRIIRAREPVGNLLLLLAMEDVTERRALERQKDILIALASHELKTPLTGAKLALQMLQQRLTRAGDASSVTQLRTIDASLNRLIRVIDGFLDVAALETGGLSMHPAPFALDHLLGEICEELEPTTTAQRVLVEQGTSVEVYGDRERTGQVLSNLLSNAIKYASATEPIRVSSVASEGLVTVRVQDRGDGIPQDQQGRIFERFSRTDASVRQRVPGVGLGLYLAAEITKRQGGRIWVESTPGEGATFCFTIPRQRSAADLPATM